MKINAYNPWKNQQLDYQQFREGYKIGPSFDKLVKRFFSQANNFSNLQQLSHDEP